MAGAVGVTAGAVRMMAGAVDVAAGAVGVTAGAGAVIPWSCGDREDRDDVAAPAALRGSARWLPSWARATTQASRHVQEDDGRRGGSRDPRVRNAEPRRTATVGRPLAPPAYASASAPTIRARATRVRLPQKAWRWYR